jgi:hypothetical protein
VESRDGNLNRTTVVYIAGAGRSGSTILDRVLGTLPGAVSCNEIFGVWKNGFQENLGCSCGKEFRNCPFWHDVVSRAFPDVEPDPARMVRIQRAVGRSRHFHKLFAEPPSASKFGRLLAEYRTAVADLVRGIAEAAGADVVVDSSKLPGEALVLAGAQGIDLRVIHLVRDSRAVSHSWRRQRRDPGLGRQQDRHWPIHTSIYWSQRNVLSELLSRRTFYLRVRYEDLMREPQGAMSELVEHIDVLRGRSLKFRGPRSIELGPVHAMLGNPQRFQTGEVALRPDVEWRTAMPAASRAVVTALTLPLLARYGYLTDDLTPGRSH